MSLVKETLRSICRSYGFEWCYGIFWGFNETNSLLLTLKDAYNEEKMGALVGIMQQQVHMLGAGVIGQVAFNNDNRWIYSDGNREKQATFGSFEDDSEFYGQFSTGIKTIAVISVDQCGVVQLGSTQKIYETNSFAEHVKELFKQLSGDNETDLLEKGGASTSDCLLFDLEEQTSVMSSWFTPYSGDHDSISNGNSLFLGEDPSSLYNDDGSVIISSFGLMENAISGTTSSPEFCQWISNPDDGFSHPSGLVSLWDFDNITDTSLLQSYFATKNSTPGLEKCSNSLFSKLGLDQIFSPSSRFVDPSCSFVKRRKNEKSWSNVEEGINKLQQHSLFGNLKNEILNCSNSFNSMKQPEHVKNEKKKAKPGTRPRPKDRQMIQDRFAELRELIPEGDKMSMDRLLERTIRHLNFMTSLRKHSETLKQVQRIKTIEEGHSAKMASPLIIEDLDTPGQLLIEILCEEQGLFLEIVDVVRGFDLIILNGVMEVQETKIWAHFVVEPKIKGNQLTTRIQVLSSLLQLLQSTCHKNSIQKGSASLFNNDGNIARL